MVKQAQVFLLALSFAVLGALPASAQDFRAVNRVDVTPVDGGFQTADGAGFGARGMWCAAADYARNALNARSNARIYVVGLRQSFDAPVTFSLDQGGNDPKQVLILARSLRVAGANLSLAHAQGFCADVRLINR